MIGTWIASIGTVAAVAVSLCLARSSSKILLKIKDNFAFIINPYDGSDQKYYFVEIINMSDRSVTIDQIGIKLHNKQVLIVPIPGNSLSTQLPKTINYGEKVIWAIATQDLIVEWLPQITDNGWTINDIKKWKIIVSTSVGQDFNHKICQPFVNFFDEVWKK
ncbi:hypothetical protein QK338_05255 [Acinetobacter ursingii]|uniref:hypothetical protein n=1 Tax=Acinetobacter ursingii TaxID=108980 RepID=UPI00249AB9C4|nr:hypothetical protein [Acinetobacter ursingii]MDI3237523.1 hypothetical protein [Acinetobacter ursingii]